jgi:predicted acyl esterase
VGEYYGGWSRDQLMVINGWMPGDVDLGRLFVELYEDERWLDRLLEQFPEADADGDGEITAEEAVRWHALRVPPLTPGAEDLVWLPKGVSHWKEMVRMRDGVELGTQVYLPEGEGPFPVWVGRGHRTRGQTDGAHWYLAKGFACVSQDLLPEGEELRVGAHGASARHGRDIASDTYDLVEWVAKQSWCSGKIGIFGYSAGGMATLPVLFLKPPSLTAVITHISSTDSYAIYRMRGGVRTDRRYDPERKGGWEPGEPPAPDRPILQKVSAEENVRIYKTDMAGWFDIFLQGSIDDWLAWKDTDRAVLIVGAGSHGPHPRPSRVPPDYCDTDIFWPDVPQFNLLIGGVDESSVQSVMFYFLMGDFTDPDAPGNLWKVTDTWPIAHEARSYHLTKDHALQEAEPKEADAAITYPYDPNDPVMRVDIDWRSRVADGPADQRPLRSRDDVVYFSTDPLEAPFMVKLLDIYPDGYEAMIAQGVLMARYHNGFDQAEPLEEGKVYKLTIDLWSTAIVFAKGHRIGIYVTSSDAGRWAVHPNSYEAVDSYEGAPVAHNSIHVSARHPSRLILPVVAPGVSIDYDPGVHSLCVKTVEWDK